MTRTRLGHHDPGFTLATCVHLLDRGLAEAGFLDTVTRPAPPMPRPEESDADGRLRIDVGR